MSDLYLDTAVQSIQRALQRTISRAWRKRLPPATDLPALRARRAWGQSSPLRDDGDLIYVTAEGVCFEWSQVTTAADDGASVIKSDDTTGPGRWLRTTEARQTGYLNSVIIHNGDFRPEVVDERIFSQSPCVAIHWIDDEDDAISQAPGALYDSRIRFQIWCVSDSKRPDSEGSIGSSLTSEADIDPGALVSLGRIKKTLAGSRLGLDGVKYVELRGGSRIESVEDEDRHFVGALGIEVRATITNGNDPAESDSWTELQVQVAAASLRRAAAFDAENYVASGYAVAVGTGLTRTPTAGVAVVNGVSVSSTPDERTFTASRYTYRDLAEDGSLAYVEQVPGEPEPDITAGALRVGVTITDASSITGDFYTATTLTAYRAPFVVENS
jgi:hypothetical protein